MYFLSLAASPPSKAILSFDNSLELIELSNFFASNICLLEYLSLAFFDLSIKFSNAQTCRSLYSNACDPLGNSKLRSVRTQTIKGITL